MAITEAWLARLPICGCGKRMSKPKALRCRACYHKSRFGNFVKSKVGYYAVHRWIRTIYGSAKRCENVACEKRSSCFEWSLLKGKYYERKRESFWELCKVCHNIYDDVYKGRKRNKGGKFI